MDRPRTFAASMGADSMPMAPQFGAPSFSSPSGLMSMPAARAAAVFAVAYIGLGMMPQAWPFEKMITILDSEGGVDPKKKTLVAAVLATVIYYLSHYTK